MTYSNTDPVSRLKSLTMFFALIIFLPFLILGVYEVARIISKAAGTPANIIVNNNVLLKPVSMNFIHAFAQGGEESTDMLSPVTNDVKALKPRLIRIDHLYDHYNVVGGSSGNLTFDFSRLDVAIDSIRATGAMPVFSLSYMPQVIAKDGVIINPPNNWSDWAVVVQKTIEHYSGKAGKNLKNVYYEVWNEPDLAQFGSWKMSGEKNYLTLYLWAQNGAGQAKNVNTFYLGGPSTTGLYKTWITGLTANAKRLDFLSWHTYLPDPLRYAQDQQNLRSWLTSYPARQNIPQLITEFGFTGAKSQLYGSMYAAAHTAAVVRQLIDDPPAYAFTFQLKDGPGQESGDGWGLITHESNGKKKKPRYHIFSFLDAMEGTRLLVTGEGTWVTGFATTKATTIRLLLVNFSSQGSHTEQVPVTFAGLIPGQYSVRQRYFLGTDETSVEAVSDSVYTKLIPMPSQSVVLVELTKL